MSFLIGYICNPQVISRRNKRGLTPFHSAGKFCSERVINFIFKTGVNSLAQDSNGNNALHFTLQQEHEKEVVTTTQIE